MAQILPITTQPVPSAPPTYAEATYENPPAYNPEFDTTQTEPIAAAAEENVNVPINDAITTQPSPELTNIRTEQPTEEEIQQREQTQRQREDCCWDPDIDEEDCYACFWLCKLFCGPCRMCCRACGEYTNDTFDGCAEGLNNCCEGSGDNENGDCCWEGCCGDSDCCGDGDCCGGADNVDGDCGSCDCGCVD